MYYRNKYEGINSFFGKGDMNISDSLFNEAIAGLISKGLVTEHFINGQVCYKLTELGLIYGEQSISDPKTRN